MPFKKPNSRNYHYEFQIAGQRYRGSCGTDDYQKAKAVEAQARVDAKARRSKLTSFTLDQAFGTYHMNVIEGKSSARTHRSQAKAVIDILGAETRIDEINQSDLAHMVVSMLKEVSPATVNRRTAHLKRALDHMKETHNASIPDIKWKLLRRAEPEERVRSLSYAEQERLFVHLREDLHPIVLFALMTGARLSTITNLRWENIDVQPNRMLFHVKMDKTMLFPINAEIRSLLDALPRADTPATRPYVFTFLGVDGRRYPFNPHGGHIWKLWRETLTAAEIHNFRFHDLRHTFATRMLKESGNLKLVSRLLGHTKIDTTMRYAHVLDDDLADAMDGYSAMTPAEIPASSPNILKYNK